MVILISQQVQRKMPYFIKLYIKFIYNNKTSYLKMLAFLFIKCNEFLEACTFFNMA